jgi:hypothetical protein
MKFVITKTYRAYGYFYYELYKYDIWFRLFGTKSSVRLDYYTITTEKDDTERETMLSELKVTAKKVAELKGKKAEIIEIFEI